MMNRSRMIVKAKQLFLDWLHSLTDPANTTLDEVNSDSTACLIQDYESDDQRENVLAHCHDLILDHQFSGWWTDKRDWPEIGDPETFGEWFDVEFCSIVRDLLDESLVDEGKGGAPRKHEHEHYEAH